MIMIILDAEIEIKALMNVYEYLHHAWLPWATFVTSRDLSTWRRPRQSKFLFHINSLISLMFVDGSVSNEVYLFINI